jgi:hypothetical protein
LLAELWLVKAQNVRARSRLQTDAVGGCDGKLDPWMRRPSVILTTRSSVPRQHHEGRLLLVSVGGSEPREGRAVEVLDLVDYPAPAATILPIPAPPSISDCKLRSPRNPPIRQSNIAVGSRRSWWAVIGTEDRSNPCGATNRSRACSPSWIAHARHSSPWAGKLYPTLVPAASATPKRSGSLGAPDSESSGPAGTPTRPTTRSSTAPNNASQPDHLTQKTEAIDDPSPPVAASA